MKSLAVCHQAAYCRIQGERSAGLSLALQSLDFLLSDIPQPEPLASCVEKALRTCGHPVERALFQDIPRAQRQQVLFLRRDQIGTVNSEQRVSPLDHLAN